MWFWRWIEIIMYVEHLADSQQLFPQYIMLLITDPQNRLIRPISETSEAYRNIQFMPDRKSVSGRVITETHVRGGEWVQWQRTSNTHVRPSLGSIFRTNEKPIKTTSSLLLVSEMYNVHFTFWSEWRNMDLLKAKWVQHFVMEWMWWKGVCRLLLTK